MKQYIIDWETDYCDNFPERHGVCEISAMTEDEAISKFHKLKIQKAVISRIEERTVDNA